jgi:hypothetical protein
VFRTKWAIYWDILSEKCIFKRKKKLDRKDESERKKIIQKAEKRVIKENGRTEIQRIEKKQ